MIRLQQIVSLGVPGVSVYRDGEMVLSSSDMEEVAMRLASMGVDKPMQLVRAALEWGKVDIHETEPE